MYFYLILSCKATDNYLTTLTTDLLGEQNLDNLQLYFISTD